MKRSVGKNEEGYILVFTLLLLVVVILLGVSATDTSIFESRMAANDAIHKRAFYQADGGVEIGIKLAYDNAVCLQTNGDGFTANEAGGRRVGNLLVSELDLAAPKTLASTIISDSNRAAVYYPEGGSNNDLPHTNLLFQGEVVYTPGSGLQMVSGYEGLGAGSAGGGTHYEFDIMSQHVGQRNSESCVRVGWRLSSHIINNASSSDCSDVYTN